VAVRPASWCDPARRRNLLVFKNGKIIYAAQLRGEAFGNILVCRHLVSEEH
jgi:hypothetical protein